MSVARNAYGDTHVSGQASVHQGDNHHYNAFYGPVILQNSRKSRVGLRAAPIWSLLRAESLQCHYSIFGLVAFNSYLVKKIWRRGKEVSRDFRITFFNRFVIYAGYGWTNANNLLLHRIRLRHIIDINSPIIAACRAGHYDRFEQHLVERGGGVNDVTQDDWSLLVFAIDGGNAEIVHRLLTSGADPDQPFGDGQDSPLAYALYKRNEDIVRLLLQHDADLDHISRSGESVIVPLWVDEKAHHESCLNLLRVLMAEESYLFDFSRHSLKDEQGYMLLNRVAGCGTPEELVFLIECGADVAWKGEFDRNAAFDAVEGNKLDNLKMLMDHLPAVCNEHDTIGWTLLHLAAERGHEQVAKFLLQQGLDWQARYPSFPESADRDGKSWTPVELAYSNSAKWGKRFLEIVEVVCDTKFAPDYENTSSGIS